MKLESAKLMMQKLLELSDAMNQVCSVIEQLDSEEEKTDFRRGMGAMLADVYIELMRPIINQFPELDPDK